MKPDISDFSYGYAVTEALVKRWRPTLDTAPVFPSLIDQGGLGYDVSLVRQGIPYFLQFKLTECMVRRTAYEVQQGSSTCLSIRKESRCLERVRPHAGAAEGFRTFLVEQISADSLSLRPVMGKGGESTCSTERPLVVLRKTRQPKTTRPVARPVNRSEIKAALLTAGKYGGQGRD
jgi:hypothetical protein